MFLELMEMVCSTSYHTNLLYNTIINSLLHLDLEISKDEITCSKIIGRGSFAVVMTGEWNGTEVAVKIIYRIPFHSLIVRTLTPLIVF